MAQMRTIGTSLDRGYREDLNFNFSKLENMVTSATNLSDEMRQEFLLKIEDLQSQVNSLNVEEILALISQMEQAVINANTAATKADAKAVHAEEKGNYAKEQGDYAKSQGTYATEKGDYANEKAVLANEAAALAQQESANLGQMKVDVVKATQDANLAAEEANEANVATQQVTEEAQILIDNTGSVGTFVLDGIYKKNNIVEKDGSSWIAKVDTQNNPLPILPSIENTWWRLVAQKGATGEQGNSFTVNAQGLLAERSNYDSELEGFSFLATDVGELYFRQGDSGWSDGIPFGKGEPGLDGKDGTTYYTWIKYADTDKGVGMSDTPAGKKYMGIAYNKPTSTKSLVASDYAWSLIQGPKGDTGETPDVSIFATKDEVGDIKTLTTTAKEIVLAINEINAKPTGGDTTGLSKQINSLQNQVTGLAKEQAYTKLKTAAQDRLENGNGTVFAHDMNGNIIGMTLDELNSKDIVIRDGKMMMINTTYPTKTVTDSTVVASAYDTSGNGGRKLVRLNTGRLIITIKSSTQRLLYRSDDNGISWVMLSSETVDSSDSALATNGVYFYNIYAKGTTQIAYTGLVKGKWDGGVIETGQTVIGNVSLTINPEGTELHASWDSKNPTYPNSKNIRYAKGVISQVDGSVNWGAVEQLTKHSQTTLDYETPTIVLNGLGNPCIIFRYTNSSAQSSIGRILFDGSVWGTANTAQIYNGNTYIQSNPSAIFVPKSINGLANGRIWVVWTGTDSVDTANPNLRVSYSDDGGATWSTMQKLTTGSLGAYNPSITANKLGEIFIQFNTGSGQGSLEQMKFSNNAWTSKNIANYGNSPSTLFDLSLNFTQPLSISKRTDAGNIRVRFDGTWQEPVETPTLTARAVYDIPSTDFVGLFVNRFWLNQIPTKTALFVNDIPMESTSDMTQAEVMYKKQLDSKAPVKLRIELSRDSIPASPNENFNGITRILGGRS